MAISSASVISVPSTVATTVSGDWAETGAENRPVATAAARRAVLKRWVMETPDG